MLLTDNFTQHLTLLNPHQENGEENENENFKLTVYKKHYNVAF